MIKKKKKKDYRKVGDEKVKQWIGGKSKRKKKKKKKKSKMEGKINKYFFSLLLYLSHV